MPITLIVVLSIAFAFEITTPPNTAVPGSSTVTSSVSVDDYAGSGPPGK